MPIRKILISLVLIFSVIQANVISDTLKVMTFNVYGAPNSEWDTRISMIVDDISTLNPDLICLQEIVETPGYQGIDNRVKILADSLFERTGIGYDFRWERTHFSWSVFDEGIAILTPHVILDNDFVDLPQGLFPRKCLWGKILTPSGIVNLFDTHLSFGSQEETRIEQVRALKEFITQKSHENYSVANILCGDFNSIPYSPPINLLTSEDSLGVVYVDSWKEINPGDPGYSMTSDNPTARIDYIFLKNDSDSEILTSEQVFNNPNEDEIFPSDHIGFLSRFNTHSSAMDIQLLNPMANDEISGEVEIIWSIEEEFELNYKIFVSDDAGKRWQSLYEGPIQDNSFRWNTSTYHDGVNYKIRVVAVDDSLFGIVQSFGTFTINNPGNAMPELKLISPRGNGSVENDLNIKWEAKDADSDELFISLEYSRNGGATWQIISSNIENSGLYIWDSNTQPNSSYYKIKIICSDGIFSVCDSTKVFSIQNERMDIPVNNLDHISGSGAGSIFMKIYDETMITGHKYQITFNDSICDEKCYNVYDLNTDELVLENAVEMDGITEGPPFDGIRLIINDFKEAVMDDENSGWIRGNSNIKFGFSPPTIDMGNEVLRGYPFPADYKLIIKDNVVDTSSTFLDVSAIPMKFQVQNITGNYTIDVLFFDNDGNNEASPMDQIYFLEKDDWGNPQLTWLLFLENLPNVILPEPNDELLLSTLKPFNSSDVFEFVASAEVSITSVKLPDEYKLDQNFPNPFNPLTQISYSIPIQDQVEISVFNILGEKITTLENSIKSSGQYSITWDGKNEKGKLVSAGLYFYQLRTSEVILTNKMLLLK